MEFAAIIEVLIFASPQPVSSSSLVRCLRQQEEEAATPHPPPGDKGKPPPLTAKAVDDAVARLNQSYEEQGRSFRIVAEAGGWRFLSHPDFAPWIERLLPGRKPPKLSPAALETLAIVAYRQPVTKSDVEAIRGVGIDGVLQTVIDRGLVHVAGRAALPGRPALYGTTDLFLDHFGIADLNNLPHAAELRLPASPPGSPIASSIGSPHADLPEEPLIFEAIPLEDAPDLPPPREKLSPVAAARKLTEKRKDRQPYSLSHAPPPP